MNAQRIRQNLGLSTIALSVALLSACGGGTGTASNTNGITPTLSGTVTGFGSVIVDGQEIEDAYARIVHENADGSQSNDVLQMGQRVRVAHDGANKASRVLIDAAVIGVVSSKGPNTLTVAGQVVLINSDMAAGPLTVFAGGYSDLSSVQVSDMVQIHGTPVYDTVTSSYKVQATRVQKDMGVARVQVNGKVAGYTTTSAGASFALNGLTVNTTSATALRPTGAALANDVQVTAYGASLVGGVLTATHVRVNRDQNSGNTSMQAQLSGAVSNYNASAGTLDVQGTTVRVGAAVVQPSGAIIANKAYVMVKGSVASDGSITATQVQVRTSDTSNALAKVQLIGVISDYVDSTSFVVRGVPVDASAINFSAVCPGVTVANGLPVRVQATQQVGTAVVKAVTVACQVSPTTQLIRPVDGTVASADAASQTFSLMEDNRSQSVRWTDTTTFVGVTADTLLGKMLRVEGFLDGTTLVARLVRLDDNSTETPELDDKQFRQPRQNQGASQGWQHYHRD